MEGLAYCQSGDVGEEFAIVASGEADAVWCACADELASIRVVAIRVGGM